MPGTTLRQQCLAALGKPNTPAPVPEWNPTPQIILPRFLGSVSEGTTLELNPISLGGKPVWLHYRALGQKRWIDSAAAAAPRLGAASDPAASRTGVSGH